MKSTFFQSLALACSALVLSGCVAVAAAAVAAGVVYTVSDDSSEVMFDQSWDTVFDACIKAVEEQGILDGENRTEGRINATVDFATVTVQLNRPSTAMVKVTVSARKHVVGVSPAPDIAERVALDVAKRLGT